MAQIRIARILQLMAVLRGRTARTPRGIAHELGVSVRTVYRDLVALQIAGMACHFDKEVGGYRMDGDFFLPPMQLTLGEAMALSVLGSQMAGRGQLPLLEEGWRAVTKIRSQLPAALREEVAGNDGHIRVEGARVSPQTGCGPHFELLRKAIVKKRKVRCAYDGGKHAKKPFLFRPWGLFFCQRAWYVIGHSEACDGERSFKLNRLLSVEPTDHPYMIPENWTLESSLGCAWRMIRGDRRYQIRIRFDKEFARNVSDTLWHPTQSLTFEPDGACVFECQVDGLDEIVWWVLGYGAHARVFEPVELIEKIREMVERMREIYQEDGGQHLRKGPISRGKDRMNGSHRGNGIAAISK